MITSDSILARCGLWVAEYQDSPEIPLAWAESMSSRAIRSSSFASKNEGGQGLIAHGAVTSAKPVAKKRGIVRQTPQVSLSIRRTALAQGPLGRRKLGHLTDWNDGARGTELNFKFYRQATHKVVGPLG